ncbi:hypothetical protein HKX48_007616 [Thoreauomyces humboldtii]|nr:hypothetical protein HKX48_007616 [Thoreauomyces humboldtii]
MAEQELGLLDNVEMRFAVSDTNERFEKAVGTFLSPVLLKLDSPHKPVQAKVMAICSHVSKRVKANQNIKLPMSSLIDLFSQPTSSGLLQSFSLIYIDLGFARSSATERIEMLPRLVHGISNRPLTQQITIFQMFIQVLGTQGNSSATFAKGVYDWDAYPKDLTFLLRRFLDVILYCPAPAGKAVTALSAGRSEPTEPVESFVPPGLSTEAMHFVTHGGKATWTRSTADFRALKLGIIRFISLSDSVPEQANVLDKFVIYLSATGDSNHEVVSAGEDGMKRHVKPDLEQEEVVLALYALYQGTGTQKNPEKFRSPSTTALKNRILKVLLRSAAAVNQFPQMIQVAFDTLNGDTTNAKLRASGMSFVQWIARMARDEKIKPVAPVLLSALSHFISSPPEGVSTDGESLRGFAYEAVGLLCKREPQLCSNDAAMLRDYFEKLGSETQNVRMCIVDALSNMVGAYRDSPHKTELEKVLLENIEKPDHHSRYIAQKYTNAIFPYSYPLARYVNLMLAGDLKPEVKEEARKGLEFPEVAGDVNGSQWKETLPNFLALVGLLSTKSQELAANASLRTAGIRRIGAFTTDAYSNCIIYLRHLLVKIADPKGDVGRHAIELEKVADSHTRKLLQAALKDMATSPEASGLGLYLNFLEAPLKSDTADAPLQTVASFCLLEAVSMAPSNLSNAYSDRIDWISSFLNSIRSETRKSMAHVLGIVSTGQLDAPARTARFNTLLEELTVTTANRQLGVEDRQGATLAIGYCIGRLFYRHPHQIFVPASILKAAAEAVVQELEAVSSFEVLAACDALAEMGRYAPLPLEPATRASVVETLIGLVKSGKDAKVGETAIASLGQMALGDTDISGQVLEFLLSLAPTRSKQVEFHLEVGEAITNLSIGFDATSMHQHLDIVDTMCSVAVPPAVAANLLATLLDKIKPGGAPAVRKSVATWLLCIVKLGGKHPVILENVLQLQNAFSGLLNDVDEFTQEAASRGMGLVFELGDAGVRDLLVSSLVSTLTDGKRITPQSVTGDTQLFQENALGSTPGEGGQLNGTYQSILSLASEMNQPDLVYRFMSLAAHNAIWNSRRGASMGFSTIAAQATEQLQPHLPKIIPKLYRFQFDPQPKTAESMKNIWQTLIPEPAKTLEEFFPLIMTDLLAGLCDRQWRIREASCLALADLTQSRQMEQLQPYLEQCWTMTFRALDDIKESVRVAAFKTCKTLTQKTVRYCDPTVVEAAAGAKIVAIVVPFFLTKGLGSSAEDVRNFSLSAILKIAKKGGVLLKPHVPDLVATLLECLSTMEPQVLNYLTFHTEKYNMTQEHLENARLSAVKSSPMMDAIEIIVEQVDVEVLTHFVPRLNSLIRKGVGLPTKAGSARVVFSLVQRAPAELATHADSIVKALSAGVFDRSIVVRKAYGTAVGQIAKLASDGAINKLLDQLEGSYLNAELDNDTRSVAGITILEFSRRGADRAREFHGRMIPLAYLGARDGCEPIKVVWADVWEELCSGSTGALRLWMSELMELFEKLMTTTPSWAIKKQVGQALGDMSKALGPGFEPQMARVIPLLVNALAGRTWDGKELVVTALADVVAGSAAWFSKPEGAASVETVVNTLLTESRKNNKPYKRHSIDALARALQALDVDRYADIYDDLVSLACIDPMDTEDDDEDDVRAKPLLLAIRANSFKALGLTFPSSHHPESQVIHATTVLTLLARNLENNVWNVRIAVMEAIELILKALTPPPAKRPIEAMDIDGAIEHPLIPATVLDSKSAVLLCWALIACMEDAKYTAIRENSTRVLTTLVSAIAVGIDGADAGASTSCTIPFADAQEIIVKLATLAEKEAISLLAENIRDIRKRLIV